MKVSKLDFNYRDICIFNTVYQLASGPSICHQIHPLSAISTTGKKKGENVLISKTSEMYINSRIDSKR